MLAGVEARTTLFVPRVECRRDYSSCSRNSIFFAPGLK
jgi:hypothetical protein